MKISNIEITNPEKIIYQRGNITKFEIVNYYHDIAPLMLKYIRNRPMTVFRCHEGIGGECFFKKHPTTENENVGKILIDNQEFFQVSSVKQLIYQVQMGTIEFHCWGCNISDIERPNLMVFDLDPDVKLSLAKLRKGVTFLKSILDDLKLKSYLKTSGGKGYHIVVDFKLNKSWEEFGKVAQNIAELAQEEWPNLFTTNIRKNMRNGKIFIDYLRNKRGASCVAPYSLRARDNLPLSMPISWEEFEKIRPNEVNIKNYRDFLPKN